MWEPLPKELRPFPHFACYLLRELGLAEAPTKQQLGISDWMWRGPDRQITVGFRGVAKSTYVAFYMLWRLSIDPFHEKLLIPGATAEKAEEVATFMLRCIREVDILQGLQPLPEGRSSVKAFDVGPAVVDQSPSVRACGILSPSLTGKRCTCATPDDIETLNNSITPLKRERLAKAIEEFESILKPEGVGEARASSFRRLAERYEPRDEDELAELMAWLEESLPRRIMYLGTPHLETSLYLQTLVRQRNYAIRFWPARYPDPDDPEQIDCYLGGLDPVILAEVQQDRSLVGQPTDPERFPHEELVKRETRMTRATVQLQFQLNCQLSTLDRFPIRLGDLIVMDLDGKGLPGVVIWGAGPDQRLGDLPCPGLGQDSWFHGPAMARDWVAQKETWRCGLFIDPAGRGRDELAWCVLAELGGNQFLLESGGTSKGYDGAVLLMLAEKAKRWQCNICVAEANLGDGMFTQLLQPVMSRIHPLTVEEVRVSGQKERRMVDTLAPLIQQHRLVVARRVFRDGWDEAERDPDSGHLRSLGYQLSRLTTERGCLSWDDRVDVLSMGCQWFVDAASKDQEKVAASRQDALQDAMLRAWFDEAGANLDALAMGLIPQAGGRPVGGLRGPLDRPRPSG